MFNCIQRLKNNGYNPTTILDIGAFTGEWTKECMNIFPKAEYYLFDANNHQTLSKFNFFNVVLSDTEKEIDWFQNMSTGDSIFKEKSIYYEKSIPQKRKTTTLEKVIGNKLDSFHSIFIKIDSQGSEIPILKGSGKILDKTDFIILEIPFFGQYNQNVPNFQTHIEYMNSIGFIPYDVADLHYSHSFLFQVDILFIKRTHPFTKHVNERLLYDY